VRLRYRPLGARRSIYQSSAERNIGLRPIALSAPPRRRIVGASLISAPGGTMSRQYRAARDSMNTFDKRQDGFEKKFAHDEELRFKANARRNRLLGQWAAEKMGLAGEAVDAYAKEVVMSDFEEAGDEDVFRKVRQDFDAKGVTQSDHQIRRTMAELMEQAIAQVRAGT